MINSRQRSYLDAMDIAVWRLRESPLGSSADAGVETGLRLGPGDGGKLLICAIDTDSASRLANDISRALGSVPVWAWPDPGVDAVSLADAVEKNLFTTVAIFGDDLARQIHSGDLPDSLRSAKLVVLPAMEDIQSSPQARQLLWSTFCSSGMVKN